MSACRERKAFSSITSKLSRMLGHVKRKRKARAVQQFDLLAASPLSPASKPFSPFFPSRTPPSKPSKLPYFASHTPSPSPLQPATYSTPPTAYSSPLCIHNAPSSAPVSPPRILHIDPHPETKDLHTPQSPPLHSNPFPLSVSVAPRRCQGKHSVHLTLWAVILLALLCTFLCIGKEIAFVVATTEHLILQLALGLGLLARGWNVSYASSHHHEGSDTSVEKDNIVGLNGHTHSLHRSWTIPRSSRPTFVISFQGNKSWTTLHSSVEREMQPSKSGDSVDSTSSERATISSPRRGNFSAKLKLQVMLLFTLGGLFHGRFLALCIILCCIFIYSKMERLFFKRRL